MSGGLSDPRNRGKDRHHRKGPVGQRELLRLLKVLIDASMRPTGSLSRDQARQGVRALLASTNWQTPFILQNLWPKRCRYLSSLGYVIEPKYLAARPGDVERINAYGEGRRHG